MYSKKPKLSTQQIASRRKPNLLQSVGCEVSEKQESTAFNHNNEKRDSVLHQQLDPLPLTSW